MKREYKFSTGKREMVILQVGKTRITICLDDGILQRFIVREELASQN